MSGEESERTDLVDVHVSIGRLAVPVHPEGQQQGHGEHSDGQQRVNQHVQQRRRRRRRLDD